LKQALLRCWYGRCSPLFLPLHLLFLLPLSVVFGLLVRLRHALYRLGVWRVGRLPVPVIVVGNLTVGGSGKTPLTIALVKSLRQAGFTPGIVSRGYGGSALAPMPVAADSDPAVVGDEPVLMARRAACPVWIGRERVVAARQLLAFHPEVDVLIADDGLQHLALVRDVELVVVDAERGFGNGWLLPAGPLREPLARLAQVDAVVINGERSAALGRLPADCPKFEMQLSGARFVNLADPAQCVAAAHFTDGFGADALHAIAGIGHPERFFKQLAKLGINAISHAFPDHHAFVEADLPAGNVLMTEKDAVKCARFGGSPVRNDLWFLAVDAEVDAGLQPLITHLLNERKRTHDGSQTA
jgi:tetraacyldisaccharide 4'-kinase